MGNLTGAYLRAPPKVDAIRGLRAALKTLGRRFGLRQSRLGPNRKVTKPIDKPA